MATFNHFCFVFAVICLLFVCTAQGKQHRFINPATSITASGFNDTESYFDQTLDHFNPQDTRTFKQRYFSNGDQFNPVTGPIFLYICGEATCSGIPQDYIRSLAKTYSAYIVTLEHRYYGKSSPFQDLSVENLRFLSSRQAINDLATFRNFIQRQVNAMYPSRSGLGDNSWFTFGVSYSGALSAWFRLKFPHLTNGSLASSGVVEAVLTFPEFDAQVVTSVGPDCSAALAAATVSIEKDLAVNNQGVKALFNAQSVTNDGDFFFLLADAGALAVQYGYSDSMCPSMVAAYQQGTNLTQAFATYVTAQFYSIFDVDPYTYSQKYFQNTTAGVDSGSRQWTYQTCSEVGYFQIAPTSGFKIRSAQLTESYFKSVCTNVFGIWPPVINATNEYYGGKNIASTKTFFTNGSQDPWQGVTLQNSADPLRPASTVVCSNCGHGVDMRGCPQAPAQTLGDASKCTPSTNVLQTRQAMNQYISSWL